MRHLWASSDSASKVRGEGGLILHALPDELYFWRGSGVFCRERLLGVAPWGFVAGDGEVVALLQDGAVLVHSAELTISAGGLAGKPMPFAVIVDQVKLGIRVGRNPNGPRRNFARPAERDDER